MIAYDWTLEPAPYEHWAYLPNFLTAEECDLVVAGCKKLTSEEGLINHGSKAENVRRSTISFIPTNSGEFDWLFSRSANSMLKINEDFFNFDIEKIEALQFSVYDEKMKGFYNKHVDIGASVPRHRKLSFSIQLTEPDDYEGGDLVLHFGSDPIKVHRERGMMIVFPSYMLHEVTPVTKGTRNSLVGWVNGPRFR